MMSGVATWLALSIFALPALLASGLALRLRRPRFDPANETGDPMNPQAIKDWRVATWTRENRP